MDINRLNEFITLATLLNYSKAANQLYLTQPALSRHIHDLEQTLGTQLFIRDTHNVHLTSVGEIFLKEAQEIIQRYNHALDLIQRSFFNLHRRTENRFPWNSFPVFPVGFCHGVHRQPSTDQALYDQ